MDEKLLYFYQDHLPTSVNMHLQQCLENADKVRQDIFYRERTINLLPLLASNTYLTGIIPERSQILKYILCPPILQTKDVTPQFIQHSSLFVNFIYSKPELFANVVVNRYGQQDFHYVIYSVVPAFYGFFTSLEHIERSLIFYQEVINIAPPNIASAIIQPLFCSLSTFQFIEAVMTEFGSQFGVDSRLDDQKRKKDLIKQFGVDILNSIQHHIHLLPRPILALFQFIVQSKWTLRDLIALFFNHFFSHLAVTWVASSYYSTRVGVFQQVLTEAVTNVKQIRDIFRKFLEVESKIEIPNTYKCFNLDYVQVFISAADIMVAAICYSTQNKLPISLTDVKYENFPLEKRFSPYIIRIYNRKYSRPPKVYLKPLIFTDFTKIEVQSNPTYDRIYRKILTNKTLQERTVFDVLINESTKSKSAILTDLTRSHDFQQYAFDLSINEMIDQAKNFESLLNFTVYLDELSTLNKIDEKRQVVLMTPMALNAAKSAMKIDPTNFFKPYIKCSKYFLSTELKRLQFCTLLAKYFKSELEKYSNEFSDLEKMWENHIKIFMEDMQTEKLDRMNNTLKYNFWVCVEELRSLANVPSSRQFELLMIIIKKLRLIKEYDETIPEKALIISNCTKIPLIVLMSDKYIMKNPEFEPLRDDDMLTNWNAFYGIFIDLIKSLPHGDSGKTTPLMAKFNELQTKLIIPDADIMGIGESDSGSTSIISFNTNYKLSSSDNIT